MYYKKTKIKLIFHLPLLFTLYIQLESQTGFLPLVLQIQASEELELGARQAGKLFF